MLASTSLVAQHPILPVHSSHFSKAEPVKETQTSTNSLQTRQTPCSSYETTAKELQAQLGLGKDLAVTHAITNKRFTALLGKELKPLFDRLIAPMRITGKEGRLQIETTLADLLIEALDYAEATGEDLEEIYLEGSTASHYLCDYLERTFQNWGAINPSLLLAGLRRRKQEEQRPDIDFSYELPKVKHREDLGKHTENIVSFLAKKSGQTSDYIRTNCLKHFCLPAWEPNNATKLALITFEHEDSLSKEKKPDIEMKFINDGLSFFHCDGIRIPLKKLLIKLKQWKAEKKSLDQFLDKNHKALAIVPNTRHANPHETKQPGNLHQAVIDELSGVMREKFPKATDLSGWIKQQTKRASGLRPIHPSLGEKSAIYTEKTYSEICRRAETTFAAKQKAGRICLTLMVCRDLFLYKKDEGRAEIDKLLTALIQDPFLATEEPNSLSSAIWKELKTLAEANQLSAQHIQTLFQILTLAGFRTLVFDESPACMQTRISSENGDHPILEVAIDGIYLPLSYDIVQASQVFRQKGWLPSVDLFEKLGFAGVPNARPQPLNSPPDISKALGTCAQKLAAHPTLKTFSLPFLLQSWTLDPTQNLQALLPIHKQTASLDQIYKEQLLYAKLFLTSPATLQLVEDWLEMIEKLPFSFKTIIWEKVKGEKNRTETVYREALQYLSSFDTSLAMGTYRQCNGFIALSPEWAERTVQAILDKGNATKQELEKYRAFISQLVTNGHADQALKLIHQFTQDPEEYATLLFHYHLQHKATLAERIAHLAHLKSLPPTCEAQKQAWRTTLLADIQANVNECVLYRAQITEVFSLAELQGSVTDAFFQADVRTWVEQVDEKNNSESAAAIAARYEKPLFEFCKAALAECLLANKDKKTIGLLLKCFPPRSIEYLLLLLQYKLTQDSLPNLIHTYEKIEKITPSQADSSLVEEYVSKRKDLLVKIQTAIQKNPQEASPAQILRYGSFEELPGTLKEQTICADLIRNSREELKEQSPAVRFAIANKWHEQGKEEESCRLLCQIYDDPKTSKLLKQEIFAFAFSHDVYKLQLHMARSAHPEDRFAVAKKWFDLKNQASSLRVLKRLYFKAEATEKMKRDILDFAIQHRFHELLYIILKKEVEWPQDLSSPIRKGWEIIEKDAKNPHYNVEALLEFLNSAKLRHFGTWERLFTSLLTHQKNYAQELTELFWKQIEMRGLLTKHEARKKWWEALYQKSQNNYWLKQIASLNQDDMAAVFFEKKHWAEAFITRLLETDIQAACEYGPALFLKLQTLYPQIALICPSVSDVTKETPKITPYFLNQFIILKLIDSLDRFEIEDLNGIFRTYSHITGQYLLEKQGVSENQCVIDKTFPPPSSLPMPLERFWYLFLAKLRKFSHTLSVKEILERMIHEFSWRGLPRHYLLPLASACIQVGNEETARMACEEVTTYLLYLDYDELKEIKAKKHLKVIFTYLGSQLPFLSKVRQTWQNKLNLPDMRLLLARSETIQAALPKKLTTLLTLPDVTAYIESIRSTDDITKIVKGIKKTLQALEIDEPRLCDVEALGQLIARHYTMVSDLRQYNEYLQKIDKVLKKQPEKYKELKARFQMEFVLQLLHFYTYNKNNPAMDEICTKEILAYMQRFCDGYDIQDELASSFYEKILHNCPNKSPEFLENIAAVIQQARNKGIKIEEPKNSGFCTIS